MFLLAKKPLLYKARCATLEDTVLDMEPTPTYDLAFSSRKDTNAVASCLKTSEPEYTSFNSRRHLIFLVSVNAAPEILRQAKWILITWGNPQTVTYPQSSFNI